MHDVDEDSRTTARQGGREASETQAGIASRTVQHDSSYAAVIVAFYVKL